MSSNLTVQAFNLLNMKTLAERLKIALEHAKEARPNESINQSELARRVGVTRGAVSLWFKGSTTSLEGENLVKAAQYLGVSPNWLATGRGRMIPSQAVEIPLDGNPDYPAIRRVNIKISAGITGYGIEPLEDDHAPIVFHRSWYDGNGYDPDKLVAIKVCGASMEPGLFDGDWVVVNTSDVTPRDGIVFALNYDGEVVIKRMFRSEGHWVAASDNQDKRIYRDRPLNGETSIIGRIVHKQSERI
ncbi:MULTISPECIES: LexA family transcriptional regulator [Burkholderia]|uniref:LexA family transcriptional regulator n=1 Tax=Burkholderia TaxID=32008 RepID=UPI001588E46D|nr:MULTISPECIES: S24 family peptidase [Burkholderia]UEP43169.1 helix-turn-helix domain-containing protein [Burkholderia sp. B21-005]